ncbi:MAG: hypothetical protein SV377_07815 [Halobacteria archaeon]|nr:hypothetical protein [Halobacteria archaeon]
MSVELQSLVNRINTGLSSVRHGSKGRKFAVGLIIGVVGMIVSYFHWVGLVVGGVFLGVIAKNLRRALIYGFLFGLSVWVVFALNLAANGDFIEYVAMGQIFYISLVIPLLLPTLSASVRGLF